MYDIILLVMLGVLYILVRFCLLEITTFLVLFTISVHYHLSSIGYFL